MMEDLILLLHKDNHSLVVAKGYVCAFDGRGVVDLYKLIKEDQGFLNGASVADKVVGKAAAALMILGNVKEVHADVISQAALDLFAGSEVCVGYDKKVPHIVNRTNTGWCPLEKRCFECLTPQDCLTRIEEFFTLMSKK